MSTDSAPPCSEAEHLALKTALTERITELNEEAEMFGDPAPPAVAIGSVMELAQRLLPWLHARRLPAPKLFLRDGGNLELVVDNVPVSRRLMVHVSKDGSEHIVYLMDSRGIVHGPTRTPASAPVAKEWIAWLCPG